MKYFGYAGGILHINLTDSTIKKEFLSEKLVKKFIGGYGVNNRLFWDYQKPEIDPFSPESVIIIGVGVLVGTLVSGASKVIATYKSPIYASPEGDHIIDNAVVGTRRFGLMLKNAGFDHIIISGKAKDPVYLKISDDDIQIESAKTFWGKKDIYETTSYFLKQDELNGILAIGQGGENLIRYSLAIADYSGHIGKFGFGAAMGSKNLKAIVVKGTKGIKVNKPGLFFNLTQKLRNRIKRAPMLEQFHNLGITSGWGLQAPLVYEGRLKYRTWKKQFGPKTWEKHKFRHNLACAACMLACRTDYQILEGKYAGLITLTGHHFLPARIALRLGLDSPEEAIKLLDVCNRNGICYFTTTGMINWLSRLQRSESNTDFNIKNYDFDEFSDVLKIVKQIIDRVDIGNVMAEGWYPLAKELGLDPDEFSYGTGLFKGADAIQDGRTTTLDPQRFTYITNPRPHHGGTQSIYTLPKMGLKTLKDDFSHAGITDEEFERVFEPISYYGQFNVGRYTKHAEDCMAVHNSLGTCIVSTLFGTDIMNMDRVAPLYSALTGIQYSSRELKIMGERNFNFYKLLNLREGIRERDRCSEIWLTPRKTPDGPKKLMDYYREKELTRIDVNKLIDDYYDERGWEKETAIPLNTKLKELDLLSFID
jgi:aldehyde:ferredoxin oxidoreductase